MSCVAPLGALEFTLTPAVNVRCDCTSAGSGPTNATPGVVRIWVITTMPSSTFASSDQLRNDVRFRPRHLGSHGFANSKTLDYLVDVNTTADSEVRD
jgi:hypothetical protein